MALTHTLMILLVGRCFLRNRPFLMDTIIPPEVSDLLSIAATKFDLDVFAGKVRRSSSRFCLGVEHGDYNGTELFGVGTDRFIWLAYKPNDLGRIRLHSLNFPDEGVVDFELGKVPNPRQVADSWSRFPFGVNHVLAEKGYPLTHGFDGVLYGNIPGGGMSRSASLTLNLILTFLEVSGITETDGMRIVDLAQTVENDYIGSPCGKLDQLMIYFAQAGMGTHYRPAQGTISHLPLSPDAEDFRLVSLDTGTVRPGLENSTYKIRREECEQLVELCQPRFSLDCLADVKDAALYNEIRSVFGKEYPHLLNRLKYIYESQQRFDTLLKSWQNGDIRAIGNIFRQDGLGLRDDYDISGPELETMCELARGVDGVLGERMLGGGDKGASGAIVLSHAVDDLKSLIDQKYPVCQPELKNKYAIHSCNIVDGITCLEGLS